VKNDSMHKMFADARALLDEITELEEFERKRLSGKLRTREWNETRVEYVKRYRKEYREAVLKTRVPDLTCSFCNKIKLRSRQWILLDKRLALRIQKLPEVPKKLLTVLLMKRCTCRSCFRKYFEKGSKWERC
jgi:hypothetical protein